MQDCFREHPDIYGAELAEDDEEEAAAPASAPEGVEGAVAKAQSEEPAAAKPTTSEKPKAITEYEYKKHHASNRKQAKRLTLLER